MRQALVVQQQVTLADVRAAAAHLDVPAFIRQTAPFVPYAPDVPVDEDTQLVRALLEIPLGRGNTLVEKWEPYRQAGVTPDWLPVLMPLRFRWQSTLVHPEAVLGVDYILDGNNNVVPAARLLGPRDRLLRPRARTLGVVMERWPGGPDAALVPPIPGPTSDAQFDALVVELERRVRHTVGGDAFLAPDPAGRALSVLAATVVAILADSACQRWAGRKRVVRADAYAGIFVALDMKEHFDVAREVLEQDHPHRQPVSGPWPPGESVENRDLAVLQYDGEYLTICPSMVLPSLPPSLGPGESGMEEEQEEERGDEDLAI